MSEQLLDLLKLCLLALLYLFFLRVMWAVWTELRAPTVAVAVPKTPADSRRVSPDSSTPARGGRSTVALGTLRMVEPPEQAGLTHPITAEMTIGRAPGCTIVIDDTFVSQIHARVFSRGDDVLVEDLGSTNGTLLNGEALSAPKPLQRGDRLQIGSTAMELI